ncbi:phospholipase D-like domain-containing protein [Fodinicola acaciae]|uniref:phospholipase D-like domain-containing protein n=1 Tax=Fodinicola acaciae TaxID=2681555 RepID=UPI0013D25FF8|nr:phospholipase D-like domain-containing protein [Fodinicola acaciae]
MARFRLLAAAAAAVTVAVTVAAGLVGATPAAAAPADGVVFNDPTDATHKYDIQNHIIDLIHGAPAGSTIRLTIYLFASSAYRDALIQAHANGVNVQFVADSAEAKPTATTWHQLEDALGTDKSKPSYAITCGAGHGCVDPDSGINHNKFALFSSTGGKDKVFVQSSANMNSHDDGKGNSGINAWNNAVTMVDEPAIYDAYVARFNAMRDQVHSTPYSSTDGTNAKVYFFPRSSGSTILGILDNVDCTKKNTSGGWGPDHLTSIHVAMYKLSDVDVAKKLWSLDDQGCVVHVVRTNVGASDDTAISALEKCDRHNGVTVDSIHGRVNDDNDENDTEKVGFLHSKYLVIDGYYDGAANQRVAWTGSYNYTTGALRSNDETLLKIRGHSDIIDAFQANFATVAAHKDYSKQAGTC